MFWVSLYGTIVVIVVTICHVNFRTHGLRFHATGRNPLARSTLWEFSVHGHPATLSRGGNTHGSRGWRAEPPLPPPVSEWQGVATTSTTPLYLITVWFICPSGSAINFQARGRRQVLPDTARRFVCAVPVIDKCT